VSGIELREVKVQLEALREFEWNSYLLDDQLANQIFFRLGGSLIHQVGDIIKKLSDLGDCG
jgi:hypothetical protein